MEFRVSAPGKIILSGEHAVVYGYPALVAAVNKDAYELEKKQHGNPSGADNTISTYGGFLWYRKETENLKTFSQIYSKRKLPNLFAINTGRPNESTKEMVSYVAGLYQKRKSKIDLILRDIGEVTKAFLRHLLAEENLSLEVLIKENESLLENLGVVSKSTVLLIRKIEKLGGVAQK